MLQSLEDRLGLNPVARQNVLRGLSALPAALGGLFDEKSDKDAPPAAVPAPDADQAPASVPSPLGALAGLPMPTGKPN